MAALLTTTQPIIVAGVDAHKDTHHAGVLDGNGVRLADRKFPAILTGYQDLLDWIATFGIPDRVGIESTGSFASGPSGRVQRPCRMS